MWRIHIHSVTVEMLQCIPIIFLTCIELSTMEPLGGPLETQERVPCELLLSSKIFHTVKNTNVCF